MRQICSVLAGYVWDKSNPYVAQPERALPLLAKIAGQGQARVRRTNQQTSRSPMNYFQNDPKTAYEAKAEAQRIAFAPSCFRPAGFCATAGILELVQAKRCGGHRR